MSKPTIVLVPGAWHNAERTYSTIKERLSNESYPSIAVELPTVGAEPPTMTVDDDVKALHDVMLPLFDEGKEVILVAHSYGGIPATVSTKDHSIGERKKQGKVGGIKHVIFLTAFAIPKRGMSLLETFGGTFPPMVVINGNYATIGPEGEDAFYNDLPKERSEALMKELSHHCLPPFLEPIDYVVPDLKIPNSYLVCKNDHILPEAFQNSMVESVPGMKKFECKTGHSPMLKDPDMLANLIMKIASKS